MAKGTAVLIGFGSIWASVALVSLFAPDLVSGSEHEHLPLAAITVWIWGVVATGYLVLLAQIRDERNLEAAAWRNAAIAVTVIWLATAVVAIFGPDLVTGSDPTEVPLAALIAPPFAAVGTAMACFMVGALGAQASTPPQPTDSEHFAATGYASTRSES
jgi:hypothetical protein